MSLASLCSISTATIKRNVSTSDASMGQIRNYTTAGRGSLPTSSTGRLVLGASSRRFAYEMHDTQNHANWYTTTDPQVDNSDILVIGNDTYFVQAVNDPDLLNRFWCVNLDQFGRQLQ